MRRFALLGLLVLFAACSGTIGTETGGDDDDDMPPPTPKTVDIEGPEVLPHVQRFANAACTDLDTCRISTYNGHSPTASRALDILVSDVYGQQRAR